MRHLYVADLDDTLLSDGALPPGALAHLRQVVDSGAHFTVATARGIRAAVAPLADAYPRLPMIALGGAVVAYADGSRPLIERIDPEAIASIADLAGQAGAAYCLLATDGRDEIVFAPARGDEFTDWSIDKADYFKAREVSRGPMPSVADRGRVIRLTVCSTVRLAAMLQREIAGSYPTVTATNVPSRDMPGFAWLEIGAPTATKEHGVRHVASLLGYAMKDVIYYGDATNDLDVMRHAGEAVAVANADASVRDAASLVIGDASTGAVVRDLLRRLGLKPAPQEWTPVSQRVVRQ